MAKLIKTSKEFDALPIGKRLEHFHKLASSNNAALDLMQKERNTWMAKAQARELSLKLSQENTVRLQDSLTKSAMSFNEQVQRTAKDIQALNAKIKAQAVIIGAHVKASHG